MSDSQSSCDEQERRALQGYIFALEEVQETADNLSQENERLNHSQSLLMAILGSAKTGITLIKNRKLSWCNPGFTDILGWHQDEIIGMSVTALYPNIDEYEKMGQLIYGERLHSHLETFEYEFVHKQGHRVPCLVTGQALDHSDLTKGYIFTLTNITARKEAERKLKREKTNAEKANRAKSDFLANMSHELRTPLNHIIGFTELVVDKNFGDLNETQEEYLNDALGSSRHLLSMINDILDLAKVETGKMALELSTIAPRDILENSMSMIKEKAMKHNIRLSTDVASIPKTITADERKFKQIIYNLLSNAVKFTPDDGHIHLGAKWIQESLLSAPSSSASAFIEVSVTDTGIGIKPKDLKRIFKPFEQIENSASRKYPGTGLGLSLTKDLIELHGGKIIAESKGEGKGSTFTFVIPGIEKSNG